MTRQYYVEVTEGSTFWHDFATRKLHCEDGPAIIYKSGTLEYYYMGRLHRTNGLPARTYPTGDKEYYEHGERHRANNLPAIEYANGKKYYYVHGKLHRDDGKPAIEYAPGHSSPNEYYLNGILISKEEAERLAKPDLCADKIVEIEGRKYKLTPVP